MTAKSHLRPFAQLAVYSKFSVSFLPQGVEVEIKQVLYTNYVHAR